VVDREGDAIPMVRQHVASGTIVHADESGAWDRLHASYDMRRVNHSVEFKDLETGACTNQAESFFSRLRRAEFGQHHRISGRSHGHVRGQESVQGFMGGSPAIVSNPRSEPVSMT
jgi:hypothetical protein